MFHVNWQLEFPQHWDNFRSEDIVIQTTRSVTETLIERGEAAAHV
jgi:hypothetical protein